MFFTCAAVWLRSASPRNSPITTRLPCKSGQTRPARLAVTRTDAQVRGKDCHTNARPRQTLTRSTPSTIAHRCLRAARPGLTARDEAHRNNAHSGAKALPCVQLDNEVPMATAANAKNIACSGAVFMARLRCRMNRASRPEPLSAWSSIMSACRTRAIICAAHKPEMIVLASGAGKLKHVWSGVGGHSRQSKATSFVR